MNSHRSLCDQFAAEFVIERYAAGRLSETETQAFEEHLLVCDRCQEELTLAVAVREALPEGEADEESVAVQRLPWKGLGAGLTLAAAAVVATVLLLPGGRGSGPIAELGRVTQPPVYLGVPVRQAPARPDSVFDAAMSAYALGDYSNAAAGLDEAMAAGADSAVSQFFRGASLLMLGEAEDATGAFREVLGAGSSPYLAEARYYLAKSLLQLGDPESAVEQLEAVGDDAGEISRLAQALTDSVKAALGP